MRLSKMVLPLLLIAGCSQPPAPPPPRKNVFDPLTQQAARARDAQKTVDENAADTRKAIDAAERGEAPP
jgi:hypothetical protein